MDSKWKKCPVCGSKIASIATRCKYCNEWITPEALQARESRLQEEAAVEEERRLAEEERLRKAEEAAAEEERRLAEEERLRKAEEAAAEEERRLAEEERLRKAEETAAEEERRLAEETMTPPPLTNIGNGNLASKDSNLPPDFQNQSFLNPLSETDNPGSYDFSKDFMELKQGFFNKYFIGTFFRHYADFRGSTSVKYYWLSVLALYLIVGAIAGISLFFGSLSHVSDFTFGLPVISLILLELVIFIPSLALQVRRMHNLGKSGAWILITLIPFIGGIWYFILTLCTGDNSKNTGSKFSWVDWIVLFCCFILPGIGIFNYVSSDTWYNSGISPFSTNTYYDDYSDDEEESEYVVPTSSYGTERSYNEEPAEVEEVEAVEISYPANYDLRENDDTEEEDYW